MKFSIRHLLRLTFVVALVLGVSVDHSPSIPAHHSVESQPDIRNALLVSHDEVREVELGTLTQSFPLRMDERWDLTAFSENSSGD